MASYLHPGVYIEEISSGARPIEGVSTSVTAFVGSANRGPVGEAILIGKYDDYADEFGNIVNEDDHMGLAVQAFYLNGGSAAYICRLAGDGSTSSSIDLNGQGVAGGGPTADPVITATARSEGAWGDDLYLQIIKPDQDSLSFDLSVGHQEDGEFVEDESFTGLTMVEDDDNYVITQVNGNSSLVEISLGDAAEIDGSSEQYQQATLTGGELDSTDAIYFSAAITGAMNLTVNINSLGAELITIDPTGDFSDVHGADGDAVASAIQTAVQNLGTVDAYQNFTCEYSPGGAADRFVLTSDEDDSAASIEIYGGDLAEILRLDSQQTAVLTGAAVAVDADLFSSAASGVPFLALSSDNILTLDIDNHGDFTITLDPDALELQGDNADDGATIALAIQNAVRAENTALASYKDFSCSYNTDREFILTSGSSRIRNSGVQVTDGDLANLLGLDSSDNPAEVPGRETEQGTSHVIPVETLGNLEQGQSLTGGTTTAPTAVDYGDFYNTELRKVRDVSIIVLPGESWASDGSGNPVISQTLSHCESTQSRLLIIDPPESTELDQAATVSQMALPTSTYSVLYYPWVDVANPFYNEDSNPNAAKTLTIAPSALAAGMWAKIDARRGVWKAPAGVEAQLNAVAGLQFNAEDLEQDQLNPLGVNCFRRLPNYGSVIWGSRTLATKAAPEWRYVPVRRTAIMIEQSIYNGIQWAVFEPNDNPLWASLRSNIGSFMNGLFRAGAFQGATSDDAYFVRCGLGDTMTQGDIDRGQVIVIVGFAPLKPAEFVIVRIQQKVNQQ